MVRGRFFGYHIDQFFSFFFFVLVFNHGSIVINAEYRGPLFFGDICLRKTEVFKTVNVKTLVDGL